MTLTKACYALCLRNIFAFGLAVVLTWRWGVSTASACSCIGWGPYGFLAAKDGALPKNANGILWVGPDDELAPQHIRVWRLSSTGVAWPVAFSLEKLGSKLVLVKVKAPLSPGEKYRFETSMFDESRAAVVSTQNADGTSWQQVAFEVSRNALTLKGAHVALSASPPSKGIVEIASSGSCAEEIEAQRSEVHLVLPANMEPFRQQIMYSTFVNNVPWEPTDSVCNRFVPGRSWMPHVGTDLIFS